jgi:hypothetical protein
VKEDYSWVIFTSNSLRPTQYVIGSSRWSCNPSTGTGEDRWAYEGPGKGEQTITSKMAQEEERGSGKDERSKPVLWEVHD